MKQFTEIHTIKLTKIQSDTLKKMKEVYKVNVNNFIRQAISEKLKKDKIKIIQEKIKCPF